MPTKKGRLNQQDPYDYHTAFTRNLGCVSPLEQEKLRHATVAIPGCGGVGGLHALTLARLGVGNFRLADFDRFELHNFNRQAGAKISTVNCPKVDVTAESIQEINPESKVKCFPRGINKTNIHEFLEGVDIVADSLDFFAFEARDLLFETCEALGIPILTGAPLGFSCALLCFAPGSMPYRKYFNFKDDDSALDRAIKMALAVGPKATQFKYLDPNYVNLEARQGPSSAIGVGLCAAMVSTEILKWVCERGELRLAPHYAQFDAYRGIWEKGTLYLGNRNPLQKLRFWAVKNLYLKKPLQESVTVAKVIPFHPKQDPATESIKDIVSQALYAPTGDNCQPFSFSWRDDRLSLHHDEERAKHTLNRNNHCSWISLGAVLEALRIAASKHGLGVAIEEFSKDKPEATVKLEEEELEVDPLLSAIPLRFTHRKAFLPSTMPSGLSQQILAISHGYPKVELRLNQEPSRELLSYLAETESLVLREKDIHQDLMKWINWNNAKGRSDGMPWETLGISFFEKVMFQFGSKYKNQRVLNSLGAIEVYKAKVRQLLASSAAIGCFSVKSTSVDSLIQLGSFSYRVWLLLTRWGYGYQPISMGTMSLYDLKADVFPDCLKETHQKMFQKGSEILSSSYGLSKMEIPVWGFRTGKIESDPKRVRTPRLPIESVLKIY